MARNLSDEYDPEHPYAGSEEEEAEFLRTVDKRWHGKRSFFISPDPGASFQPFELNVYSGPLYDMAWITGGGPASYRITRRFPQKQQQQQQQQQPPMTTTTTS
jgi:hypothetical protein